MFSINWNQIWWKIRTKWFKIFAYVLGWGLLSMAVAYPSFVLYSETSFLNTETGTAFQFCKELLVPALLFLAIFMLDIAVALSGRKRDKKGSGALSVVFCFLMLFFGSCIALIIIEDAHIVLKKCVFFVMWGFLISIKGIIFYMQEEWDEEYIVVLEKV